MISAIRYHDISLGHRVAGHESKCAYMHGHNYRVYFEVIASSLDAVGRVLDFSVIKSHLCMWLEVHWDHKFLAWEKDELMTGIVMRAQGEETAVMLTASVVFVPFNPTAENMAKYLVEVVGPRQLVATDCVLNRVVIEETRKCSVAYTRERK